MSVSRSGLNNALVSPSHVPVPRLLCAQEVCYSLCAPCLGRLDVVPDCAAYWPILFLTSSFFCALSVFTVNWPSAFPPRKPFPQRDIGGLKQSYEVMLNEHVQWLL